MEELNAVLGNILADPAKLGQLRQAAQTLGLAPQEGTEAAQEASTAPQQAQQAPLEAAEGCSPTGTPTLEEAVPGAQGADALAKLAALLQQCSRPDQNEQLLLALRPHFSPQRAGRIDDAIRIMQLCRLWPALRESGLLGELGSLLKGGGRG